MSRQPPLSASIPTLRQMLVRFWPLIRKQRALIASSIVALLVEVSLRLLEPWPIKLIVDNVIAPEGAAGSGPIGSMSPTTLLAFAASAVVIIAGLRAISTYLRQVGFAIAGSRVLTESRSELFTHLQRLSLSFHSKRRTGDLITRVTGDIGRLKDVTITAVMPLVAHVITLLGMLAVMFWMEWRLAVIAIAIMPIFFVSTIRLGGRIRQVARVQRQRQGEMGATAVEALGSIKTVQALSLEDVHATTFSASNNSDLREGVKAKRLSARLIGTADVLTAVGSAAVLYFGARMVLSDELTIGELLVFVAYFRTALRPVRNLAKYAGRIAKAAASAERIVEVLETTPQIADRADAKPVAKAVGTIAFENVTFGYEPDHAAIKALTLDARRGDVIVLAGQSGAGKSTIVNLLLRLYDADEGRITLDGRDIRDYTVESVRRAIAVVPQENVLFAVSLRDNIAYGAPGATDQDVVAAAHLAQAHEFIVRLPDGYDTHVGERGETLSEGQRRRIALARAAIRLAPILVLDEPTASLDNENTQLVREAIQALSRNRISFIVAHDLSTVLPDNRVVFLDRGLVVEHDTHEALIERDGQYAAMYALQQKEKVAVEPGRARALRG